MQQPEPLGYEHTQDSPQWLVVLVSLYAIVVFSFAMALIRSDEAPIGMALLIILTQGFVFLAVLDATRLTTAVTPNEVRVRFRLGWPSRVIDRGRIVAATAHRNTWLHGWGIRKIIRGWLWAVWGLDSVELELDDGRIFRIGTDDTAGLLAALGN